MTPRLCAREADVLLLVAIGQWPRQADGELVHHVSTCESCAEALSVARALHDAQDDVIDVPVLPDARAVWQRAQWQARRDAQARAARPVVAMQVITGVVAITAMLLAVVWLTSWTSISDRIGVFTQDVREAATSAGAGAVAVAGVFTFEVPVGTIWLVAGAVAVGLSVVGLAVAFSALADRSEA